MKWIKRLIVLCVILLVVIVGVVFFALDGVIKSVVQSQGTAQLHVNTTLGAVSLGLLHGTLNLDDMALGSPAGFTAPQMMSIGKLAVDTGGVMRLRDQPIHLSSIVIDAPKLVVEQKGQQLNFKALMDGLPKTQPTGKTEPAPQPSKSQELRLIIDSVSITNAHVALQSDIPGLTKPLDVALPTMDLKNLGNADGSGKGAPIKDLITAVITQMVDQATKTGKLPVDISGLMSGNLDSVKDKLGDAGQKELDKLKVPVNVNGLLNQLKK